MEGKRMGTWRAISDFPPSIPDTFLPFCLPPLPPSLPSSCPPSLRCTGWNLGSIVPSPSPPSTTSTTPSSSSSPWKGTSSTSPPLCDVSRPCLGSLPCGSRAGGILLPPATASPSFPSIIGERVCGTLILLFPFFRPFLFFYGPVRRFCKQRHRSVFVAMTTPNSLLSPVTPCSFASFLPFHVAQIEREFQHQRPYQSEPTGGTRTG